MPLNTGSHNRLDTLANCNKVELDKLWNHIVKLIWNRRKNYFSSPLLRIIALIWQLVSKIIQKLDSYRHTLMYKYLLDSISDKKEFVQKNCDQNWSLSDSATPKIGISDYFKMSGKIYLSTFYRQFNFKQAYSWPNSFPVDSRFMLWFEVTLTC